MARRTASPGKIAALFALAGAVGALGGVLGYGFQLVIDAIQVFGLGRSPDGGIVAAARGLSPLQRVAVPAAGGLLAALALAVIHGRRSPFGIGDIMELVITRSGAIRLRDAALQIASSAASIGTGSSIGRESAISQLGAMAAATLSRIWKVSTRDRSVLLGCGVAAGMAVSYHAPIAGALFVMEVVLGNFAMDVFAPVVISAVTATLVIRQLQPESGDQALYAHGGVEISMTAPAVVLSALLLGCVCGAGAIGFRQVLAAGRRLFARLRLPPLVAMPLGGAMVGAIGIYSPQVWGNGQSVVLDIFANVYDGVVLLISIMVLKTVATSISLGSGALGGMITPNLVVGAALGASYAYGVGAVFPSAAEQAGGTADLCTGFALVGMAGLFAGTAHAPITAVLLVFEFTRNYGLILPVMLCSILASLVARLFDADSAYTQRLRRRGHLLAGGLEALALQTNYVRDVMRGDHDPVLDDATFEEVMRVFTGSRRGTVYVVDHRGQLRGHIHIHDVKFFLNDPNLTSCVIAADLTRSTEPVTPDHPLAAIFERFDDPDLEEVPVVRGSEDHTLIGRMTRRDVIALLSDEVLGRRTLRAKLKAEGDEEATFVELPPGSELARVPVPEDCVGQTLGTLDLPARARLTPLVVVRTGEEGIEERELATPGLALQQRDVLIVLGQRTDIDAFDQQPAARA